METTQEQPPITTKQLDDAIAKLSERRKDYEEKKRISNDADALVTESEQEVLSLLEQANKKNYQLDGVAKVISVTKFKVNTPKDLGDKAKFFKWLNKTLGADGFLAYATINYNSLQALWNQEYEKAEDKVSFNIDGIGSPIEVKELRMNKL